MIAKEDLKPFIHFRSETLVVIEGIWLFENISGGSNTTEARDGNRWQWYRRYKPAAAPGSAAEERRWMAMASPEKRREKK